MRILFLILISLFLTSCFRKALIETETNNNEFKVDLLFEYDGCKAYRFEDGGRAIYYTNCNGSTNWNENCGKSCNRNIIVNTNKQ